MGCGLCAIALSLGQGSERLRYWFSGGPPATHSATQAELEAVGWNFPAWDLDESRLEEVRVFSRSGRHGPNGATFLSGGEEGGELLLNYPGEWCRYDEHGEQVGERDVKGWGGEVERFEDADGTEYVLEQRGEHSFSEDQVVQCLRDGEVLWRRRSRSTGWQGAGPIRLEDGRALVLLYDHDEWLALHPDGTVAWDRSGDRGSGDRHSAHPALPGIYLSEHGNLGWHHSEHGGRIRNQLDTRGSYSYDAAAFAGPKGERLAFSVGTEIDGRASEGALLVVDEESRVRWSASAPTRDLEVERLDVDDGPPLFVVATDTGDLFVIDAEGTVLHHRTLPQEPREELGVAIYELDAGPLGPDHIGIAVTMLDWIAVYRLKR